MHYTCNDNINANSHKITAKHVIINRSDVLCMPCAYNTSSKFDLQSSVTVPEKHK